MVTQILQQATPCDTFNRLLQHIHSVSFSYRRRRPRGNKDVAVRCILLVLRCGRHRGSLNLDGQALVVFLRQEELYESDEFGAY